MNSGQEDPRKIKRQICHWAQSPVEVVGPYLGSGDAPLPHHLDVVLLPDALLEGGRAEVDEPPETEALEHPQLVQLRQVLPVPAHL